MTVKIRARRALDYFAGEMRPRGGPAVLSLETTLRCNLTCPMCPRATMGPLTNDLPEQLLYPLLEQHAAGGGDFVYLYGLGEPLMDKRLGEILRRARALGLGTVVSTNACFLDQEAREMLLSSGCDHLIASIDGVSPEVYARYRPGGDLRQVEANVEAMGRMVKRRGGMDLVVQMVRLRENRHEEDAFVRRWLETPGVASVRLKEEELGFEDLGLNQNDGYRRKRPCHILWRGPAIVRWNGDVFPCHPKAARGESLGNLEDSSLDSMWRGEAMGELRALHREGRCGEDPICATCPINRPLRSFAFGAMALKGTQAHRLLPIAERLSASGRLAFTERRLPSTSP